MEKKKLTKLFIEWTYKRLKIMMFYFNIILLFWVVFGLSKVPLGTLYYSSILVIFMGVIIGIWDFISYKNKYEELLEVYYHLDVGLQKMGEPKVILEDMYQEILKKCEEKRQEAILKSKTQEVELMDYYTLWVHQIKVPITAMDLMLQDNNTYRQEEMKQELFRIGNYVEMALQYLRIESMSQDMVLRKYELYSIVKEVIKKYAMTFIHKKIKLEIEPFNLEVYTDEKWITFVIEQLISNSLKYTNKGSITISVRNSSEKVLIIQDTGIGIEKEDLPRIFDRGFTGYNGRMSKKSTGLGLYLCKEVTKKLSHGLKIDSSIGAGTTASIYFYEETCVD